MNAQPKSTGKYSHWLNIEPKVESENPVSISMDHVDQEYVVLLTSEQEETKEVIDTKKREIENIEIHGVYERLPDICQKCIATRWVIIEKFTEKRKIMKACIVALILCNHGA